MITLQMTEKICEMAKIKLDDEGMLKAQQELCKMAEFTERISEAAAEIELPPEKLQEKDRSLGRLACNIDTKDLSENAMHIKDGFFRIEAGERK